MKTKKETPLTKEYFVAYLNKNFISKDYLDKKLEDYPTKDYLNKNFISKDYLDKKLEDYPTKDYFDKKLSHYAMKSDLIDLRYQLEKKFDETYQKTRDDMIQFKDDMVSMFLDLKTEIVSMKALYDKHDEEIKNLTIR